MQKAQQEALRKDRENNIKNIQSLENIYMQLSLLFLQKSDYFAV
jgi:hypothetical protein